MRPEPSQGFKTSYDEDLSRFFLSDRIALNNKHTGFRNIITYEPVHNNWLVWELITLEEFLDVKQQHRLLSQIRIAGIKT
jgi:hypothetical protein